MRAPHQLALPAVRLDGVRLQLLGQQPHLPETPTRVAVQASGG